MVTKKEAVQISIILLSVACLIIWHIMRMKADYIETTDNIYVKTPSNTRFTQQAFLWQAACKGTHSVWNKHLIKQHHTYTVRKRDVVCVDIFVDNHTLNQMVINHHLIDKVILQGCAEADKLHDYDKVVVNIIIIQLNQQFDGISYMCD